MKFAARPTCRKILASTAILALCVLIGACRRKAEPAFIYASNEASGDVTIIDGSTNSIVARVPVGKRPRGLRVSKDGRTLFVALSGSPRGGPGVDESKLPEADRSADGIGVVDVTSRKLLRTLRSGQDPESFDISSDGRRLYVSNEETAEVSFVDVASGNIVTRVKVGGEPEGVTRSPDGGFVYVTCEADNRVYVIDAAKASVITSLETGLRPRAVVFTQNGGFAFVSAELSALVTVIDARAHRVLEQIKLEAAAGDSMAPLPMGLALSKDDKTLYVSNGRAGSVSVIDVPTRKLKATWPKVGKRPWGIDLSLDDKWLYTANGPADDVSVIETATGKVHKQLKTGERPWGVAVAKRP